MTCLQLSIQVSVYLIETIKVYPIRVSIIPSKSVPFLCQNIPPNFARIRVSVYPVIIHPIHVSINPSKSIPFFKGLLSLSHFRVSMFHQRPLTPNRVSRVSLKGVSVSRASSCINLSQQRSQVCPIIVSVCPIKGLLSLLVAVYTVKGFSLSLSYSCINSSSHWSVPCVRITYRDWINFFDKA